MSNLFEHCRGAKEVEIIKAQIVRGVFFVHTHLNMANLIPFTKRFESSEKRLCRFCPWIAHAKLLAKYHRATVPEPFLCQFSPTHTQSIATSRAMHCTIFIGQQ